MASNSKKRPSIPAFAGTAEMRPITLRDAGIWHCVDHEHPASQSPDEIRAADKRKEKQSRKTAG